MFRNHSQRSDYSLEVTRVKHMAVRFLRGMAHAEAVQEKDQRRGHAGSRMRRNIFGSIVDGLKGLVTEEQLKIE